MTSFRARHRETAIAATEGTCPRCGTPRQPDQEYCLECGLALPVVSGRLASLRRRWIERVGWYPGDWVWASLLTLLLAIAGAGVAIALTHKTSPHGIAFTTSPPVVPSTPPITTAPTTTAARVTTTTSKPATTTTTPAGPVNGQYSWPATENGWTVVLVSYPKTTGHDDAVHTAEQAAKSGLTQVGVLDSSLYASLQPGYYVVFTGIYGSKSDADGAVATARQAGFGGAYSRQVAR
ncbi:MAG TPA: zinc ribbon domain-containing protein [Gaiellaceae bacterium]|nr:zinc ribbon domain-containing protein [Gaiellaceae bacterium]